MPLTDAQCKNAVCPPEKKQARFTDAGGMYQTFLAASQRAPRALTASFSAKGVTRLMRMAGLSVPVCRLNHSRHIPMVHRALPYEQRVASLNDTREVPDDDAIPTFSAPDIGEEFLSYF